MAGYCSLALLFPLLAACSSDSPSEPYKDLKQVNFPQEKSTVLLTKPTGHIVDGYNQLLEVYTVQETLDPISTIDGLSVNRGIAFGFHPGLPLNGDDFMKAKLERVYNDMPSSLLRSPYSFLPIGMIKYSCLPRIRWLWMIVCA